MADLTAEILAVIDRQHGVISTRQLTDLGLAPSTRRRLEHRGVLVRDHKWVRRLAGTRRCLEQRCSSICLAHPTAFVTGATAAKLIGLRRLPATAPLTISSPHPLHIEHPGVLLRRTTKLDGSDTRVRPDAIRIASPARLAFDLGSTLGDNAHRSVIEQMLYERLVTEQELAAIGRRLAHPARPGSRRFLHTLLTRSGAALESDPEIVVADALLARGVPVVAQVAWLDLPNGSRARIDLSVPALRWGVEIDVHPDHLGLAGTTSDKRRDRQCHLIGWQVERVTTLDLLDIDVTADELAELYSIRSAEAA